MVITVVNVNKKKLANGSKSIASSWFVRNKNKIYNAYCYFYWIGGVLGIIVMLITT